ncbi:hypothetical protein C2G38_2203384 [Gigaspora rosea]|uniref:Uncharacterized protein n=1 Tax=Gigaspora rosea TaxID=44941 RepID=A0A397UQ74_9GLOM|nr:hypothetical protein C2G38_2203384 [Gigaspora rosea]
MRTSNFKYWSWPFAKLVIGKSGTGKTNILKNLVLGNKAEHIYKKKKVKSRYIWCDNLIVCEYHSNEPKWSFVKYMYRIIASNPRALYYENIRFSYISPEKISSLKSFSLKEYKLRDTNNVKNASIVINSYLCNVEFIVFDLNKAEDDSLAIWLRFDTLLNLLKETELWQKHKIKNELPVEPMNSEPLKS